VRHDDGKVLGLEGHMETVAADAEIRSAVRQYRSDGRGAIEGYATGRTLARLPGSETFYGMKPRARLRQ